MRLVGDPPIVASSPTTARWARAPTIGPFCVLGIDGPDGAARSRSAARLRSHVVLYRGTTIGDRRSTPATACSSASTRPSATSCRSASTPSSSTTSRIGDGVRLHSRCFVPEHSVLEEGAWLGPGVIVTNARYPNRPDTKDDLEGVTVGAGAVVGAGRVLLPGCPARRAAAWSAPAPWSSATSPAGRDRRRQPGAGGVDERSRSSTSPGSTPRSATSSTPRSIGSSTRSAFVGGAEVAPSRRPSPRPTALGHAVGLRVGHRRALARPAGARRRAGDEVIVPVDDVRRHRRGGRARRRHPGRRRRRPDDAAAHARDRRRRAHASARGRSSRCTSTATSCRSTHLADVARRRPRSSSRTRPRPTSPRGRASRRHGRARRLLQLLPRQEPRRAGRRWRRRSPTPRRWRGRVRSFATTAAVEVRLHDERRWCLPPRRPPGRGARTSSCRTLRVDGEPRRASADRYRDRLRRLSRAVGGRRRAPPARGAGRGADRDRSRRAADGEAGVATGVHYPVPLSQQPAGSVPAAAPNAEHAAAEVLSLPMDPLMTDAEVDEVCDVLAKEV